MSEASSAQAIGPIKTAMRDKVGRLCFDKYKLNTKNSWTLTALFAVDTHQADSSIGTGNLGYSNDSHLQRHHAAMKSVD
ncbi:hypothetical protein PSTT_01130 [Puccinia striiformis]|uniref:Uncharacterized protein n=1 Tax=Puccinia striiformis TaxID=27350 RepID=A0A2S4W4F4_9BASI|nr:hypothetical protein PSTT_01130 [Puccinia striiformis]